MQEQVNDKTVALTVKATKITGRLLAQAMRAFLKKAREPHFKTGKQSVRSLAKQGSSLTSAPIDGENIGSFNRIARKYNVDFALKCDDAETPPKWVVFFKAKDSQALFSAFTEYGKLHVKHDKGKPSMLDALEKAKELATQLGAPAKNRSKGGHEL